VDESYFHEYYLVLASNGDLYKHTEKSRYYGGSFGYQRDAEMIADLNLTVTSGASMTMLNESLALISLNSEDGVILYTYDLEEEELTELGVLEGVTDLVGLTMPAVEEEEEAAQAANKVTGSTMTATASESEENVEINGEDVTIADGNVTINLYKEGTNGKLVVTFDPAELTYQGMSSASVYYSVNDADAAEGKLVIAYAAASAISEEDILATLSFTCNGEYVDTVVNVATEELNEDADVDEDVDIVVSNALSDDNTLASLTVQEGLLSPIFAPTVTEYTVEVAHDVEELNVSAIARDEKATVVVESSEFDENGIAVVTVTVTAENGDVRVYTITATREAAPSDPSEPSEPEDEVDTSVLEELIEKAKGLKESDYSKKSWNALLAALRVAESVLSDEEHTQEEVDNAADALDKAIKALVPATGKNPGTGDLFLGGWAAAVMLFSAAALAVLMVCRKRFFRA